MAASKSSFSFEIMKRILDACCGSRMFWFDKQNEQVLFTDNREYYEKLDSGHVTDVNPNLVADFRKMPFEDSSFYHVVFDPLRLLRYGNSSWSAKKYGELDEKTWKEGIQKGSHECMRVLKPDGMLVFKWNEEQIKLSEISSTTDCELLYGSKRAKTYWLVLIKASE